ncbi:pentatricopeptide repeat-containing protein At4g35850, mitochondrial-like [Durio zibethinus]|uniref:Pentatricopeptide repeat-containing protein At4g35850, mitochondrial-like n=1 Tax=Durio zibethinus TaxID=66656 RepID=A0A6P5YNM6_DURZI|nr:pentatricopeptide repeat-containing protein At4g35850, mitochondrial-like [Durio zibethinus]
MDSPFLLRDVYDDMMVDGVQPTGDIFVALIMGTMRGARLQDAFFFRDEMRAMGLVPEVALYNFLISTCGKWKNSILAIQIVEEMKRYDVKPNGQTYVCLLNAWAAAGRLDQALAIVHDMTAAGFELNKFCYAGLMVAHINKMPRADDVAARIIELAEQSKGWSSLEASGNTGNAMLGVSEEERLKLLLEMLKKDGKTPDTFITMQTMRCYLHAADINRAVQIFEDYLNEGKPSVMELYATLVEGAMVGHTPRGRQLAQETLVNMTSRKFFLNNKVGSDLLLAAAGEKVSKYLSLDIFRKIVFICPFSTSFS